MMKNNVFGSIILDLGASQKTMAESQEFEYFNRAKPNKKYNL
jgi:hypothetical protein